MLVWFQFFVSYAKKWNLHNIGVASGVDIPILNLDGHDAISLDLLQ